MTSNPHTLGSSRWAPHASRAVVVGLLAAVWSLVCPSTASASLLSPAAEDAVAGFLAVFVLFGIVHTNPVGRILIWLAAFITLWSMVVYLKAAWQSGALHEK